MIVVVRPEVPALLVERFDVRLQRGQSERVERQDVLSVFGLAVRLDDPAVYDDAGYLDRERPGGQVKRRRCAAPGPASAPPLCLGRHPRG